MGSVDRLSGLPDAILHHILSFHGTRQACQRSILSKRWFDVWSSNPVLDFRPNYFYPTKYMMAYYDQETVLSFLRFVDNTMKIYSERRHSIKKLYLEVPYVDAYIAPSIDRWLTIAVENQIQELGLEIFFGLRKYSLPEILFSAESLKVLKCCWVGVPGYQKMKLDSLQFLELTRSDIYKPMLQRIISTSPLIDLRLLSCLALENFSETYGASAHSKVKVGTLRNIKCYGNTPFVSPLEVNIGLLRNLRKLELSYDSVTDDIMSKLVYELASLESLTLSACGALRRIKIFNGSLRNLHIAECNELEMAVINTTNLIEFCYKGEQKPSLSATNVPSRCDSHFHVCVDGRHLNTEWFIELKAFLVTSDIFKVLHIDLSDLESQEIAFEENELRETAAGPAFKLQEVKLHKTFQWALTKFSLSTFLDGLFWSCRPKVLSICTNFRNNNVERLLDILKDKVKFLRHPLKRIEVEGVDSCSLLSKSELEIQLRLHW